MSRDGVGSTMGKAFDVGMVLDHEFDALKLEVQPDLSDEDILSQKYPAKAHARKVADELRKGRAQDVENGLVFLPGEPTRLYEESDQGPEFRQRRYFYYMTGVDIADCDVTYEIARNRLILWIPYVEPRQALYFGSAPDAAKALKLYDVDKVCYRKELPLFLKARVDHSSTLFLLNDQQAPQALQTPLFTTSSVRPRIDSVSLKPAMDRARVIKDAHEIALIRRANAISSAAHREVARLLLRLRNEQDAEAIIHAACTARGAHSQAYHIIVGSGPNAATLHYDDNNQPLAGREVIVLDAGCEFRCYASDITRTLPISGSFGAEGAAIHAIVQRMQNECIEAIRPGVKFADLHALAARIAADGLLRLGILRGDRREVETTGVVSAFFPHGLGHHVGLEVHDVSGDQRLLLSGSDQAARKRGKREPVAPADLITLAGFREPKRRYSTGQRADNRQTLEPGMVVTVEPGIYFNHEYIYGYFMVKPQLAKLINVGILAPYYALGGVRVEDDILVTEDGYENLTTAPKDEELLDVINGTYEFL